MKFVILLFALGGIALTAETNSTHLAQRQTMISPDQHEADLIRIAKSKGPLEKGRFRIIVFEGTGKITFKDLAGEKDARQYADDAASETEDGPVSAYVFNDSFQIVYTGKHY